MKTYQQLRDFYFEQGCPTGYGLNKSHMKEFKKDLKEATSWIDEYPGEVKLQLRIDCILNDIIEFPPCVVCGNPVNGVRKKEFNKTCSNDCSATKRWSEIKLKYGDDWHPMIKPETRQKVSDAHKSSEKCLEYRKRRHQEEKDEVYTHGRRFKYNPKVDQYGREYYSELEWFGGFHPNTLTDGGKMCITRLRNGSYGEENMSIKWNRFMNVWAIENGKYGGHPNQRSLSEEIKRTMNDIPYLQERYDELKTISALAEEVGVSITSMLRWFKFNGMYINPSPISSTAETEIKEYIENLGYETIKTRKMLGGQREVDIFLPSVGVGIEYNGVHWHSDQEGQSILRHQQKAIDAYQRGFRLATIWEDEWVYEENREKTKEMINRGIDTRFDDNTCYDVIDEGGYLVARDNSGFHCDIEVCKEKCVITNASDHITSGVVGSFVRHIKEEYEVTHIEVLIHLDKESPLPYTTSGFLVKEILEPDVWGVVHDKKIYIDDPNNHDHQKMLYDCGGMVMYIDV